MAEPEAPVLYKRKYLDGDEVSLSDLRLAYKVAARLVARDGDQYLPLFERMDKEIKMRQHKEKIKAKALEVAKRTI